MEAMQDRVGESGVWSQECEPLCNGCRPLESDTRLIKCSTGAFRVDDNLRRKVNEIQIDRYKMLSRMIVLTGFRTSTSIHILEKSLTSFLNSKAEIRSVTGNWLYSPQYCLDISNFLCWRVHQLSSYKMSALKSLASKMPAMERQQ